MDRVTLIITLGDNNANKMPKDVLDYETPIYQELHGENNVSELEGSRKKVEAKDLPDAAAAYDQLKAKFSTKDGEIALAKVYPNFSSFVAENEELDIPEGTENPVPAKAKRKK